MRHPRKPSLFPHPRLSESGGPASGGGTQQNRRNDIAAGDRLTGSTLGKLNAFNPEKIVTWCPSCTYFLGEVQIPQRGAVSAPLEHFSEFVVERMDRLAFKRALDLRVALHAHTGSAQQDRDAAMMQRILCAIPGVELVPLAALDELGRHCSP